MSNDAAKFTTSLTVQNSRVHTLDFVLEPWGEIYAMASEDTFVVSFSSTQQGKPTLIVEEDAIVVYGWQQSVAKVWHNGDELTPHERPPVPAMPMQTEIEVAMS